MTELISPAQAQIAVIAIGILLIWGGGAWGFWRFGIRGLAFAVPGLLVAPLWQMHLWLTRYNPQNGALGLINLKVLLGEFLIFVILGMALSWILSCVWRVPSGNTARETDGGL